jgi:hypothetical protein
VNYCTLKEGEKKTKLKSKVVLFELELFHACGGIIE